MIGELAFAFVAGSVATVNPCGFALLPAYLARRLAVEDGTRNLSDAIVRALAAGAVMTFGFLLIFGVGGGAIALGAGWLAGTFPWAGFVIGVVLAAAGLAVLRRRQARLLRRSPALRNRRPYRERHRDVAVWWRRDLACFGWSRRSPVRSLAASKDGQRSIGSTSRGGRYGADPMIGELAFAFVAGSVATVNPCGFALLPAYLARRLAVEDGTRNLSDAIVRALAAGAVMTFGFLLIFGVGGGAIALGAGWLAGTFPWAGFVIGVVLAAAGLAVSTARDRR